MKSPIDIYPSFLRVSEASARHMFLNLNVCCKGLNFSENLDNMVVVMKIWPAVTQAEGEAGEESYIGESDCVIYDTLVIFQ